MFITRFDCFAIVPRFNAGGFRRTIFYVNDYKSGKVMMVGVTTATVGATTVTVGEA